MPKPVVLPPTDKTPEEIARAILNYRPAPVDLVTRDETLSEESLEPRPGPR